MKKGLLLFLLVFVVTNILFAQLTLSLVAKGSYGFENIQHEALISNQSNAATLRLRVAGPTSTIELRVRPAFEIGAEGGFALNERINAIVGLNFQQVRLETIPETPVAIRPFPLPESTLNQIYYLKIPILLEVDLHKDKLFLQGGIYAASKIGYHHKKLKQQASNPLVFDTTLPADESLEINSSDQFNGLLFGFQTGIKYQFWKDLSIDMSYSHSLNNLFDEDTSLDMKLNNFSFGIQWRFI